MINFTDEELKHLHDVLAVDVLSCTSKLDAIHDCKDTEGIAVAIKSGLYSDLLDDAESGLTVMKKIVLALDDEGSQQENLQMIDEGLKCVEVNRRILAKDELL